ncbi:hypothetical protein HDU85_007579 [Gaertneriomyces sp. JEL0708]|nr:hypothetical protein HDU85_007579 [Gaertneriomyces sp. JEL0708]
MEQAFKVFREECEKLNDDLAFLQTQLETELVGTAKKHAKSSGLPVEPNVVSPVQLLARLEKLELDVRGVRNDVDELRLAKKTFVDQTKQKLDANVDLLKVLPYNESQTDDESRQRLQNLRVKLEAAAR